MSRVIAVALACLSLGGCESARNVFGAINVFGGEASKERVVSVSDASQDEIRRLPGGLVGDAANSNHLPDSLQPANPQ